MSTTNTPSPTYLEGRYACERMAILGFTIIDLKEVWEDEKKLNNPAWGNWLKGFNEEIIEMEGEGYETSIS